MDDDRKFSYFFLGLGIGVAVGILWAPKSGAETRDILKSKADEGKDYLKRRSHDIVEQAETYVDRGKQAVQRQKEQLSAAVEAGRQAYRETVGTPGAAPAPTPDDLIEGI